MLRSSRVRTLIAACLIGLLLPYATASAAPVLQLTAPAGAGGAPQPSLAPPTPQLPPAFPPPPVSAPADRGLEALGGYGGLHRLLQEHRTAVSRTEPGQAPASLPAHRYTPAGPRPQPASPATGQPATDPAAAPLPAPAAPVWDMRPPRAAAATASPYSLTISQDLFGVNEQATVTFTLRDEAGLPAAGATITIGDPSAPGAVTDSQGTALLAYQAAPANRTEPVYVATPAMPPTVLGHLYTVQPGYGLLVVRNVTDRAGAAVANFDLRAYQYGGTWGRPVTGGQETLLLPATTTYVDVTARRPDGDLFLTQSAVVADRQKTYVHPSASDAVRLTVEPLLDWQPVSAGALRLGYWDNPYDPLASPPLGRQVWVTPGCYQAVWYAETGTEALLLGSSGCWQVGREMSLTLANVQSDLGQLLLDGQDGAGNPLQIDHLLLQAGEMRLPVSRGVRTLKAPAGFPFRPDRYEVRVGSAPAWTYRFRNPNRNNRITLSPEAPEQRLLLGGPLIHPRPWTDCLSPGCAVRLQGYLTTLAGHLFEAAFQAAGETAERAPAGTAQLLAPDGGLVEQAALPGPPVLTIPPTATGGTYQVLLEWPDLGPYQGAYRQAWDITLYEQVSYQLTLSQTVLPPQTDVRVTATVTRNGQPLPGAVLQMGDGGPSGPFGPTDAAGRATLAFRTPHLAYTLTVGLNTPEVGWVTEELYVVPEGHGVLRVTGVTARDGNVTRDYLATFSAADANGNTDTAARWPNAGRAAMVRPAGSNWVTVQNWETYLTARADVPAGAVHDLQLSAAGTVRLETTATLDGQPVDGNLFLHNEAAPVPTQAEYSLSPALWVTPGTYTVHRQAYSPQPMLLTRTQVDLQADTAIAFTETTAGLASLAFEVADGHGNLHADWAVPENTLRLPGLITPADPRTTYLVTAGIPYAAHAYRLEPPGSVGLGFANPAPAGEPAVPGQRLFLRLGGPLQADLQPVNQAPLVPGGTLRVTTGLSVAGSGHRASLTWWTGGPPGSLLLKDPQGYVLWRRDLYPTHPYGAAETIDVPLPHQPGSYTLRAEWNNFGDYSPPTAAEYQLPALLPLELTVTPRIVPAGTPTRVTVQARRGDQPAAGMEIDAGRYGTLRTDENGLVSVEVNETSATAMALSVRQPDGATAARANLFVLAPGFGGLEIGGLDAAGRPLDRILAIVGAPSYGRNSDYATTGSAALVVPTGEYLVQVIREGRDAYWLHTRANAGDQSVTTVVLDGAAAAPVTVKAALDGQGLNGYLIPRLAEDPYGAYGWGAWLDGGTANLRVTPGTYDLLVNARLGAERLLATFPAQALTGGTWAPALDRATLGRLELNPTLAGQPAEASTALRSDSFVLWTEGEQALLMTPGTYTAIHLYTKLRQADGSLWAVEYAAVDANGTPVTIAPGQTASLPMPLDIATAAVETQPLFRGGDYLSYNLRLRTGSGWQLTWIHGHNQGCGVAPVTTSITDADGQVVHTAEDACSSHGSWRAPQSPSSAYTMTMSRNLGLLGFHSATATSRLRPRPDLKLRLDREIVPVGVTTPVRGVLTNHGRPVAGAQVQVRGETWSLERTDARGRFVLPLKPTQVNFWEISYRDESDPQAPGYVTTYVYALKPGYGLLDVVALDRSGEPLEWAFSYSRQPYRTSAYRNRFRQEKLILPAGPATVTVQGMSRTGEGYYLMADAIVAAGVTTRLETGPGEMVPVDVSLLNNGTYGGWLALRHTEEDDQDSGYYGGSFGLSSTTRIWVTPGTYEGSAVAWAPTGPAILPTGTFHATTAPVLLTLDPAAATASITLKPEVPAGAQPGGNVWVGIRSGRFHHTFFFPEQQEVRVRVVPGTYHLEEAGTSLREGTVRWYYQWEADRPLTVAAGEHQTLVVGRGLTAAVAPDRPVVTANQSAWLRGAARDENGLLLRSMSLLDEAKDEYLGWEPNRIYVEGPAGTTLLEYGGSMAWWGVPPQAGLYRLRFEVETGPLAGKLKAEGSVQVVRPRGR